MLSVSTVAWDGHGMDAALDGAAACGLSHVEPAFIRGYVAFEESDFSAGKAVRLRGALAARGLSVLAVSAHIDLTDDAATDAGQRRIGFVSDLGARILVTNAGPAAGRDAFRRTLDTLLPHAQAAGVVLALENPGHGSGDLIPDAVAGAALLDSIGAGVGMVGLNLDLGNVYTYAQGRCDLASQVAAAGPHLCHLHVKDVAETGDDWEFVPIGQGALPYADLLRHVPPTVPIGLELPLRLRRPAKADPVRGATPPDPAEIAAAVDASVAFVTSHAPHKADQRAGG